MDAAHSQQPKLPNIMCGDHPSFISPEVPDNKCKDDKSELEYTKEKDKKIVSFHNISPCTSRGERGVGRAASELALRACGKRQLEPGVGAALGPRLPGPASSLVHAAGGSARWAPHAVLVLALALLVAHALHALAAALAAALPPLRKLCKYCRKWTEETWRSEREYNRRLYPLAAALLTALLYSGYFALYVAYCVTVWAIEPLCADERAGPGSSAASSDVRVTDYEHIPPKSVKRD